MPALPPIDPWQRIVAIRATLHGFSFRASLDTTGPSIVRPPIPPGNWTARPTPAYAGNIVWTGSTARHTVAYNGPRSRWWGHTSWSYDGATRSAWRAWFAYNGAKINAPGPVLAAAVKVFPDLPAQITSYTGTGTGALTLTGQGRDDDAATGDWTVTCVIGGGAAKFSVTKPNGQNAGTASLGQPWSSGVRFTITPGGTAFAPGDEWKIAVENPTQHVTCTNANDPTSPDVWSRRAVDAQGAKPWTTLATLTKPEAEVRPVPQPWFINASATKAVTMRAIRAADTTLSFTALTFDLDTLERTDAPQTLEAFVRTVTETYTAPPEYDEEHHEMQVSASGGPSAATIAQDFIGDDLIEIVEEVSGSYSNDTESVRLTWPSFDLNASSQRTSELVFKRAGAEILRHPVFSESQAAATIPVEGSPGTTVFTSASRTVTHKPLYAADIATDGTVTLSYATGTWTWAPSGTVVYTQEVWTCEAQDVQQIHRGAVLVNGGAEGTYKRGETGGGGTATLWFPVGNSGVLGEEFQHSDVEAVTGTDEGTITFAMQFPGFTPGPFPQPEIGLIMGFWHVPIAGVWAPHNTLRTRVSAQDSRGNLASFAEVYALNTSNAEWTGDWFRHPGAAGDEDTTGNIGWNGTGTYDVQTAGPDGLTAATIADLTGYAGEDFWDVGVY